MDRHFPAAEVHRRDAPYLDPGDAHWRAGLEATGVVEIDVDRVGRLKAEPAHHDDEASEETEGDDDEDAYFDFHAALAHGVVDFLLSRGLGPDTNTSFGRGSRVNPSAPASGR